MLDLHTISQINELQFNALTIQLIFHSFVPIHFRAETDIRFVYCAGE